ncbi:iron uptake system protein EfeO [Brevibacillus fulvus]|uniref:Iron uptake system component EfeO n=1 Tax=Brevibacillus fulvus TaxID=1125967 RepID=A0A938Y4D5_9BACL|nr:iron uptake system protein EfeO [Brevibacillus fulvus]MBM7591741.1 iron uptake system component EfeO [Brevibacillus fulvus]
MKVSYVTSLFLSSTLLFAGCSSSNESAEQTPNQAAAQPAASQPTAAAQPEAGDVQGDPQLAQTVDQYRSYVVTQCDAFVKATEQFANAVKAGNVEQAKKLYAPTRMYYERIEPIAEALGDLDPNIDAREGDVPDQEWRGFHRIEQALWEKQTAEGQGAYADQLLQDVKQLRALVETVEIDGKLLVTGAVELLNEVSSSKVTGEEERYSHTDLYDFAANVEGAQQIFVTLKPVLAQKDQPLTDTIEQRFDSLFALLAPFKQGEGYVSYTELKQEQTKQLSQAIDALAEPLSQMGTALNL